MSIGFTGTQEGMTLKQARELWICLSRTSPNEFHHGDCVGADEVAHYIAKSLGIRCVGHPPTNSKKRAFTDCDEWREPLPYLDRNREIVDETEETVACPKSEIEELRSGTWSTVRYAIRQGKLLGIIVP